MINLYNTALRPKICDTVINHLILYGSKEFQLTTYPQDESGRHFSDRRYFRELVNNESVPCPWLMHSETRHRVFCFCCLCFDQGPRTSLGNDGSTTGPI
jgi:hypothetical protein